MKNKYTLILLSCILVLGAGVWYKIQLGMRTTYSHTSIVHQAAVHNAKTVNTNTKVAHIDDADVRGEKEENETDGMMQAMHQEIELTKDPALGYVPYNRIWDAVQYIQKQRTLGTRNAISGIKWTERGPNDVGGRTRAVLFDPHDATHKTVWAAGVGGGLWKTTNVQAASPNWKAVNDFFADLAITTIAYDSSKADTMYFGTGEGWYNGDAIRGNGIFKSTDGGKTWAQLSSTSTSTTSNFNYVQRIQVHPKTHDVYAATSTGIYRSQNGGTTWSQVLSGSMTDIQIASNHTLYAATGIFSQGAVYKSTTGNSSSWATINTSSNGFPTTGFDRVALACAPSNPLVVYAMTQNTSDALGGIYQTIDGGTTWTSLPTPTDADGGIGSDITRGQAWYDLILAVDPNNANTITIGGVDLFQTTDGGNTWSQISHWYGGFGYQYVHADQHAIVYQPGNSSNMLFGNDGGIWYSTNGGTTITSADSNYNVTQYYAGALNPTKGSNQMLAGAQDNGTERFAVAGIGWGNQVVGGDGAFCHIDQKNPKYQYASYVYSNFYVSSDSGYNFNQVISDNTGPFINPSAFDNTNKVLYSAYSGGQYSYWAGSQTGGSTNTHNTVSAFNGGTVTAVTVSDTIKNRVYFGLSNGKIICVDNANTTAPATTDITGTSMPSGSVSCITIQPANSKHIVVTFSNYGVNSVWETKNSGTTWTSIEGNLPDMPIRWSLFVPSSSTKMLLATELGVWTTDSLQGGSTVWGASDTGLANVRVCMLKWRTTDNVVMAITHGRGVFTTTYFSKPHAAFAANVTTLCDSGTVTFSNASTNATTYKWTFGDGTNSSSATPSHKYTACGNYTVQLIATNALNYHDTLKTTAYVQVRCLTTPVITSAGGDKTVCKGSGVAIGSTASKRVTYSWQPATGLSTSTISNPTASPTSTTHYTLTSIDSVACSIDTMTVNVNPIVVPSISIAPNTSKTICAGTSVIFTATPVNGGTPVYQWKKNGSNVGTGISTYTNSTLNNKDIITCILTSNATCASPATATSNSDTIIVNPLPSPVVSSSQSVCIGLGVNIGGNAAAHLKYSWQPVTGLTSGTANNPTASPTLTTTYTLTATDTTTNCIKIDSVPITVNQKVTPVVTINAVNSTTVCAGTPVKFNATPVNGGTPVYHWKKNGINTGINSNVYTDTNPANDDIISATLISSLSCVTNDTALSKQDTIKVNALPVASAGKDTSICAGQSVKLGSTPLAGDKYKWLPVTALSSDTTSNPIATPTLTTTYIVTATDTSTTCNKNDTMVLTVNPHITIGTISGSVSAAAGYIAHYIVTNHAGGVFYWTISANGTITNGQGTDTLSVRWNNKGSSIIKVWTECSDTSRITVNVTTGVYDITNTHTTRIYPNPTTGVVTVEFNALEDKADIIVTDALGRTLITRRVTPISNHQYKTNIDLSNNASGIYFIQIKTGTQSVVKRIIKE